MSKFLSPIFVQQRSCINGAPIIRNADGTLQGQFKFNDEPMNPESRTTRYARDTMYTMSDEIYAQVMDRLHWMYKSNLDGWLAGDMSRNIPTGVWLTPNENVKIGSSQWWSLAVEPIVVVPVSGLRRLMGTMPYDRSVKVPRWTHYTDLNYWPKFNERRNKTCAALRYLSFVEDIRTYKNLTIQHPKNARNSALFGGLLPLKHEPMLFHYAPSDARTAHLDHYVSMSAYNGYLLKMHGVMRELYNTESLASDEVHSFAMLHTAL